MADLSWMIRHRFENSGIVDSVAWICRLQGGDENDDVEGGPFPSTPTPNSFVKYKKIWSNEKSRVTILYSSLCTICKISPFFFFSYLRYMNMFGILLLHMDRFLIFSFINIF